jgi:hypothetical protein
MSFSTELALINELDLQQPHAMTLALCVAATVAAMCVAVATILDWALRRREAARAEALRRREAARAERRDAARAETLRRREAALADALRGCEASLAESLRRREAGLAASARPGSRCRRGSRATRQCVVCLSALGGDTLNEPAVLEPCMHVLCEGCGVWLARCPVCRRRVTGLKRIFL